MELPEHIQDSQRCQSNMFHIAGNSESEKKDLTKNKSIFNKVSELEKKKKS